MFNGQTLHIMRVVLISEDDWMRTISLSDSMDGRFRFEEDVDLPIYFEAENGRWSVFAKGGVDFEPDDGPKVELSDRMATRIRFSGKSYALYVEEESLGDNTFLPYYLEERTSYVIGRSPDSDICYPNDCVSWRHAQLSWRDGAWYISDDSSTNGTYVNGRKLKQGVPCRLRTGDDVFMMGLRFLMGSGFASINNANDRIVINTPRIRRICKLGDVGYPNYTADQRNDFIERRPRKWVRINPEPISIEMPPMSMNGNKVPMLLRMGSPMVMGGRALATGNIVMALTSLVFPALTQGISEKDRKEYETKRLAFYKEYLAHKETELLDEKRKEERKLNEKYPILNEALRFAQERDRLWERRKRDEDFLSIRIGTGDIPMLAKRDYPPRRFEVEADPLVEDMYLLAERDIQLESVPIMLSLVTDYVVGILGPSVRVVEVLRGILMQLVLTHSYDEVKVILLTGSKTAEALDFVRYLPHNWDNDKECRFFAASKSDAQEIGEHLSRELEPILNSSNTTNKRALLKKTPAYVVVALDKELFDCVEVLKNVLSQEEYCGVSIIAAFEGMPKECSQIIDLHEQYSVFSLSQSDEDKKSFTPEIPEAPLSEQSMRELMHTKLRIGSQAYALPSAVTFLEMYGVGKVEHLNPLSRWRENDPVKSLAAPVGIGTDGRLFTLDLHEKRQGPHGLIAGMTGSGKSEFIITYILSMAVNYSPDEVAFILIDYKGGGLADAFENKGHGIHLPHLVGTITNLDGDAIQRSLMSINSELKRRQALFKEVKSEKNEGTLDIYDYQKLYRTGKVSEPLPHLFIISDEFAELKQQQPDFMDELISAARIGRSLGVHLILATQKPGGVVNNQIWSNTKFRVCLKVQDRGDSIEMLKRPEAAELKQTGRFYLQVGYNEYFALGQSAWCGADYFPQEEARVEPDTSVQFLDNVGQTILSVKPKIERKQAESRQIVAIVNYLSNLARRENIQPKSLWTDPLPKKLELSALQENAPSDAGGISAIIGMVDDPANQRQFPLALDLLSFHNMLLIGEAGSGKSTFLRTMLYSLLAKYSPEEINYYIVDLSGGLLNGFSKMPHCGAYLTENNETDWDRLMNLLNELIEERKKLFQDVNVPNFESYRKIAPLPLILVMIDGFANIKSFQRGNDIVYGFGPVLRDGANYGIRYILTGSHADDVGSRIKQELDYRIAVQAKDRYAYSDILGIRCAISPPKLPGRGVCVVGKRALEYQAAILGSAEEDQRREMLLRDSLQKLAERYEGRGRAKTLPMLDAEQSYEDFLAGFSSRRIPLGYHRADMKKVALPLQQMHSISLYFGNPLGIAPVFRNLLLAAEMNGMRVVVFKRSEDSVFGAGTNVVPEQLKERVIFLNCTAEDLTALDEIMLSEIAARNVFRDAFCRANGIPESEKGRAKRAEKYIRENSIPMLVIFESFGDLCRMEKLEWQAEEFSLFFERTRGYNIYFAAGFYPEDISGVKGTPLMKSYNREELLLLFGGRYDKQCMTDLPMEFRRIDKANAQYDRYLLKYRDEYYPMLMPCGTLDKGDSDPDNAAII